MNEFHKELQIRLPSVPHVMWRGASYKQWSPSSVAISTTINIAANRMCPIGPRGVTHIPLQQPLQQQRYCGGYTNFGVALISYLRPTYIPSLETHYAIGYYIAIS
eukprot:1587588-Pleurochrysis_carterae.AAC.1